MGLNFQTCTIINANKDVDGNEELFKGAGEILRIKRDFVFEKKNVKSIYATKGANPVMAQVTISNLPTEGNCRLEVFVKYEGAEPAYGANPMHTYKGIPFWVEFKGSATSAADIVAQIKKDHLFLIDKDVINTKVSDSNLVLTAASEYVRFAEVKVIKIADDGSEEDAGSTITVNKEGSNGFGTYSHIIKDLRLPTAANSSWTHLRQGETPVVGALYNQYIIEYCAPAINDGTIFVGHRGMNWTTHVFWVNQDVASTWETALAVIDPDGNSKVLEGEGPTANVAPTDLDA